MKLAKIIGHRLRVTSTELQSVAGKLHKPENLSQIVLNEIDQSGTREAKAKETQI